MTLRAEHVVPAISQEASGPSYSVPSLCLALASSGVDVTLHVLRLDATDYSGRPYHVEAHRPLFGPGRLGFSPSMRRSLTRRATSSDVLHNHSLWMMPNVYPGFVVAKTRCRLVTSPRGVFATWAWNRSKALKRAMWWLAQRRTVDRTDCFHATADPEYEDVRARGFRAPVAVIPNGVEIPVLEAVEPSESQTLLFLGRIHPVKRVDVLVRAWARVADKHPQWRLSIAGPTGDADYGASVRALVDELRAPRVTFRGPVFGAAKQRELRAASLLVLPSHSENFGMAVAEGLASAVPTIATRGTPWAGLESERCGWWIEGDVDSLTACLDRSLALPRTELSAMGTRGREWMTRDFSWQRVGERMAATYAWLVNGGATPPWVRLR